MPVPFVERNGKAESIGRLRHSNTDDPGRDEIPDDAMLLAMEMSQQQFTGRASNFPAQVSSYTGWNYIGINAKATIAASAKAVIYDNRVESDDAEQDEDKQERADKSFRWWNLLKSPSLWQTGRQLRQECIQQLGMHGMSLVWNVKNGYGKTKMRVPIPMALVSAIHPGFREDMPYGGIRIQSYQWIANRFHVPVSQMGRMTYLADKQIPIQDLTLTAYPHPYLRGDGYSPMTAGEKWTKLVEAAEKAQSEQYERGPNRKFLLPLPKGMEQTTENLNSYQRKVDWQITNTESGVVVVASSEGGREVTIEPDQMAYIDTINTLGPAILALHGVPKAAVGLSENHTYGSNAAAINAFTKLWVQSSLDLLADEDTHTMRKEEGRAFSIGYDAPHFNDPEIELQETEQDVNAGILTVGELRQRRGLKPLGDERDNMVAGGEAIKQWGVQQPTAPKAGAPAMPGLPQPSQGMQMMKLQQAGASATPVKDDITQKQQRPLLNPPSPAVVKSLRNLEYVQDSEVRSPVIAFDLDGTLAHYTEYVPGVIGEPREEIVELTHLLYEAGCNIVIYTSRDEDAVVGEWLDSHGIPWSGINENPSQDFGGDGSKMLFDVLIDDRTISARTTEGVILQGVLSHLPSSEYTERIRSAIKSRRFDDRYGYLMIPVGGKLAQKVRDVQKRFKREHLIGDGLESDLHITVLYGMVGGYEDELPQAMSVVHPLSYRFQKKVAIFGEGGPHAGGHGQVAVVIELESEDLHGLHSICTRSFAHIETHPRYRPHITLGYVAEEFADEYRDMKIPSAGGKAESVIYKHPGQSDLIVPLRA